MKLIFLGTRGNIRVQTERHRRHSSLLLVHRGRRIMIDCGLDWGGMLDQVRPDAIVLTHAHPDHAFGLKTGALCPVFATEATWRLIDRFPLPRRHTVQPRTPLVIDGMWFEAFEIDHSTRCPAVSYRIQSEGGTLHYAPDVAYIRERAEALGGVDLYIGDGATPEQPMIRSREGTLIGHSAMRTQLTWCGKEGVRGAVFTHLGTRAVENEDEVAALLERWGGQRGLGCVRIAYDGMELDLTPALADRHG